MFRKMLSEQIQMVQDGADPINTFRDPATNRSLDAPDTVRIGLMRDTGNELSPIARDAIYTRDHQVDRYSPVIDQVLELYRRFDEKIARQR